MMASQIRTENHTLTTGEIPKPEPILPPTRSDLRRLLSHGVNLGKRLFIDTIADLHKPLPDEYISSKSLKGEKILYLDWHTANMILDYVAPNWEISMDYGQIGDRGIVKAKITLHCEDGSFSRESIGSDNTEDEYFGGFMPDAESQAMRRAAARFGLGLYLYDKAIINAIKKRI
jgi:hypothetical protein